MGIAIHPDTGQYLGYAPLFAIYRGESRGAHKDLIGIVGIAERFVDERIAALIAKLEMEAKAIPPLDRLKLPLAGLAPGPDALKMSRGEIARGMAVKLGGTP